MGLTNTSTGNTLLSSDLLELKNKCNYVVGLSRKSKCTEKAVYLMH
jgi:hypothetical protein